VAGIGRLRASAMAFAALGDASAPLVRPRAGLRSVHYHHEVHHAVLGLEYERGGAMYVCCLLAQSINRPKELPTGSRLPCWC
jgi:hypothetical protein